MLRWTSTWISFWRADESATLALPATIDRADREIRHCFQHCPGDHDYAGMDIFRLTPDGKIVEHWDVLQVIPDSTLNENGMF
mgnify:CR=1 FL=1